MCNKKPYKFQDAKTKLESIQKIYGNYREKRVYWCESCKSWHLSSQYKETRLISRR